MIILINKISKNVFVDQNDEINKRAKYEISSVPL